MPTSDVVGRQPELGSISAFLDRPVGEPAALVLVGDPGIGKSTLWCAATTSARKRGSLVLSAQPAEAERWLPHAGLGDLLDDVVDDLLPELSMPRRQALEIALLRDDAPVDPLDARALGVAVRDVLHLLGERTPVLVAIDDVQWLDRASSGALAFALRRLVSTPVLVLLARRLEDGGQQSQLEQELGSDHVEQLAVGPLGIGALHRVLSSSLGRALGRRTIVAIHERSGGNPFFAVELACGLDQGTDPLRPIPVPATLEDVLRARLAGLPETTRVALALASALEVPTESLLEQAGVTSDVLEPAIAARVIAREHGRVQFTHPLLASVLYSDLGDHRPRVHARIAGIIDDPVLQARHLALSRVEPDGAVAAVVDAAIALAAERGAAAAAAELAEHALRLTPADETGERRRRVLGAARAERAAGEWTRARALLTDLLAEPDLGPLRAEALILMAKLVGLDRAMKLLEEALLHAWTRPELQARIQCELATATRIPKGFVHALEHARAALALAEDLDDDSLRVEALIPLAFLGARVGEAETLAQARRAHELATAVGDDDLVRRASIVLADLLEPDAARSLLESEYDAWRAKDELAAADVLQGLAWVELEAGHWQLAAAHADQALEINVQYGLDVPWNHLPIAVIAAHRGEFETARAHSELALRLGEEQFGSHTPIHLGTLGTVAWQCGDPSAAAERFGEAGAVATRVGWRSAACPWVPDHVETMLALGQVDDAVRLLEEWEQDATCLGSDAMLAQAMRCRGLVAAATGRVSEAATLLEQAVTGHEQARDRFGRARALLALGVVRRRQRQKRAARDAIEDALAGFEALGATTWVEKARAELGRIGGRTRIAGLTPAEQRVAVLVAGGRTNREVAAALLLGERTVETHLTHVYAKLGVRSRAELAVKFQNDRQSSGELAIPS